MTGMNDVQRLYEEYILQVRRLEEKRKPGDGLLGLGKGPADDSCHDRFAGELAGLLDQIAGEGLPSAQIQSILTYIYRIPLENRETQTAYWMLMAVHGLTLGLLGQLTPSQAQTLWEGYKADYPRWERLPVQKQVLSTLNMLRKQR